MYSNPHLEHQLKTRVQSLHERLKNPDVGLDVDLKDTLTLFAMERVAQDSGLALTYWKELEVLALWPKANVPALEAPDLKEALFLLNQAKLALVSSEFVQKAQLEALPLCMVEARSASKPITRRKP